MATQAAALWLADESWPSVASASSSAIVGLVEPALLEQRAAEHELRVADLVDHVLAVGEQLERLARLLLGELRLAGAQVHLRERRDAAAGLDVLAEVERDAERVRAGT